jgi:3'-phosphoadenosine 5'-phosphosulfate sulfotransferase (PAPS reductase)/FAD synthetase
MKNIEIPPEVQDLLDRGVPVIIGTSGGKDSSAVCFAIAHHLRDYPGPKLLLHADLDEVEWLDSWPSCQRMAAGSGIELASCTRPAGGMMLRWESRWTSSIRRYCEMTTVSVVLPWSTPAMRFCQSELKVDPITAYIKRRFGQVPVLNVTGVRAEESASRAKQPVCAPVAKLPPGSLAWRPIHRWTLQDVWDAIALSGVAPHEAYTNYGSSRVSCRWCILASEADMRASLQDPAGWSIYARMCDLELDSGFAFQGNRWLTSLAPHLVQGGSDRLLQAQELAALRVSFQAWVPKHLQFTKGWPHCVPEWHECERLAEMRQRVCGLYGWQSPYLTALAVRDRYQELWELKQSKLS